MEVQHTIEDVDPGVDPETEQILTGNTGYKKMTDSTRANSYRPESFPDIEDENRFRTHKVIGQKKFGPLDRNRKYTQSKRQKVSHLATLTLGESTGRTAINRDVGMKPTANTKEQRPLMFFRKKFKKPYDDDDSSRQRDIPLVNLDTIFKNVNTYTNVSWFWRKAGSTQYINHLNDDGLSLLHIAAQSNNVQRIEDLLEKGIDINIKSPIDEATPLHVAVRYNCVDATEALIRHGAEVTDVMSHGQTVLHLCCRRGHLKVLKILLETANADVNWRDKDANTPLHQAVIIGDVEMCKYLVEKEADFCAKDINDETPLMLAAKYGFLEVIHYFLTIASQQGMPIGRLLSSTDNEGNSALHLAVACRHHEVAKYLIERGAPVNCQKVSNGYTALHQAAVIGDAFLVELLIDEGAVTEQCDKEQMTPLHKAALYNRVEAILILIRQGLFLDARDEDRFTPLLCASWKGQVEAGRALLRYGANINVVDKELKTCLHWAVENQHEMFVKMLFEEGHDGKLLLEKQDRRERTPLHYAAEVGNVHLVKFLLGHGAKADRKNSEEKSPLHVASENGQFDCVMKLYEAYTSALNDDDVNDMTPLLLASRNGHQDIVRYLVRIGADVESRNNNKQSALALAAQENHVKVVNILIENNVDMNTLDKDRNSPLHLCAHNGHAEPAAILLANGADVLYANKYGKFPLDIAIEQKHEGVAKAILSSDCWELAMHNYDRDGLSPMKKLIEVLPEAALQVLDQCVTKSHEDNTDPELKVSYDYRFVDPGPDDISYRKNNSRYFALETMVEYRRETLLAHPLSQNILARKWKEYAAFFNYFDLVVYIAFLAAMMIYLHFLKEELQVLMISLDEFGCAIYNNATQKKVKNEFDEAHIEDNDHGRLHFQDRSLYAMQLFMLIFVGYRVTLEISQFLVQPRAYVKHLENWLHWTLYISTTLFVVPPFQVPCIPNLPWGALSAFVTWMNFIFILQRFDYFGLYVAMFFTTLKSLLKAMVVYVFFIIGFALAFYFCFQRTHESFRGEWQSIVTTFVMTLGEINKGDLLDSGENLYPFTSVANFLLLVFLFLMPMVLINLTIGISVGDIDEILQSSYIKRFGLQVDIIFGFEKKFPLWLQRKVWIASAVYRPNRPNSTLFQKVSRFLLGSATEASFISKKAGMKVANQSAKSATVIDVLQEITRHESILHSLNTMMSQQGALLQRLAESQGLSPGFDMSTPPSTTPTRRASGSTKAQHQ